MSTANSLMTTDRLSHSQRLFPCANARCEDEYCNSFCLLAHIAPSILMLTWNPKAHHETSCCHFTWRYPMLHSSRVEKLRKRRQHSKREYVSNDPLKPRCSGINGHAFNSKSIYQENVHEY